MLSGSALWAADQIQPLDGDFLDYLGDLESDDDNWTLLDGADASSASQDSETEDQAEKPSLRKPSKEAAKPAVEQR
jgi:hypothetical protein